MEDEIIKALGDVTKLYIFPVTTKVVVMKLGLVMKREEFAKFNEWLVSKGFRNVEIDGNSMSTWMARMMGYDVLYESKRHVLKFQHTGEKMAVFVVYVMDDVVRIEAIVYFERN